MLVLTDNRYPRVSLYVVGFLANGNAHDADGIADYVGGALLALGPVGIA